MSNCAEHEPFALQVTDDSMDPEFPAGCVVVIEPAIAAIDSSYVICRHDDELLLRQLLQPDPSIPRFTLHALNPAVNDIKIDGRPEIVGLVIRRNGRRRRDGKSYL